MIKPFYLIHNLPVEPTHINFLNLVQNPTKRLQICLKEYTTKLSFFLGTGFIAGLETVPWVDFPVDFPEPDKSILSNYYFIIVVEPELKINMEFK